MRVFTHENFDIYEYKSIPLNRDCCLMDIKYAKEYEQSLLKIFDGAEEYEPVGRIAPVSVQNISENSLKLSWYPNHFDRFHEVNIVLPKEEFELCVGCWKYDENPHLFVKGEWLNHLYLRQHSVFMIIDAIDVRKSISKRELSREKLVNLRVAVDKLASIYQNLSFISFADTILIKSNWTVGHFESNIKYTYEPETFLKLFKEIGSIYKEHLGLDVYGILTQGSNEYYDDPLLHISESKNHICLNSLGEPFAELTVIDKTVRAAIKNEGHPPSELYLSEDFYNSLKFKFEFNKDLTGNHVFLGSGSIEKKYYYIKCQDLMDGLRED